MSKIENNTDTSDIRSYKELSLSEVFDFINDWLPHNYSKEVQDILPDDFKVDRSYIREVKKEKINNEKIVYAMYRVAQFHKLQLESI